jgi:hypothetical protein
MRETTHVLDVDARHTCAVSSVVSPGLQLPRLLHFSSLWHLFQCPFRLHCWGCRHRQRYTSRLLQTCHGD